jgi:hypothetical protein
MQRSVLILAALSVGTFGCQKAVEPLSVAHVDRSVGPTAQPLAVDPAQVGSFPATTKSGGGYFYDEVLEYRVWLHPERGAGRLAAGADYFAAFARYESALAYWRQHTGAEEPLVLVRQRESIDEPTPGTFKWEKTERITEWRVPWLEGAKRGPNSIPEFLAAHEAPRSFDQ